MRLFHREDECYIVAEGSFANEANAITENGGEGGREGEKESKIIFFSFMLNSSLQGKES